MTALADREFKWTLGGRKLKGNIDFYKFVGYTGVHTAPGNAGSVYHKLMTAVASEANIVVIGTPAANDITLGLEGGYEGVSGTGGAAQLKVVVDASLNCANLFRFIPSVIVSNK